MTTGAGPGGGWAGTKVTQSVGVLVAEGEMSFRPSPRHHLAELLLSSTHPNADGPTGPLCARPATQRDGRRKDSRNNRNSLAIPSIKRAAVGGRGGKRMRTAAANHAGASGPGVPRDLKQPYVRMYVRRGRRFSSKPPNQGTPAKLGEASGRRPLQIPTTSTRGGGENVFFFLKETALYRAPKKPTIDI